MAVWGGGGGIGRGSLPRGQYWPGRLCELVLRTPTLPSRPKLGKRVTFGHALAEVTLASTGYQPQDVRRDSTSRSQSSDVAAHLSLSLSSSERWRASATPPRIAGVAVPVAGHDSPQMDESGDDRGRVRDTARTNLARTPSWGLVTPPAGSQPAFAT